jgi:hypothetical protein
MRCHLTAYWELIRRACRQHRSPQCFDRIKVIKTRAHVASDDAASKSTGTAALSSKREVFRHCVGRSSQATTTAVENLNGASHRELGTRPVVPVMSPFESEFAPFAASIATSMREFARGRIVQRPCG